MVEGVRQPHLYFGIEHVPLHHYAVKEKGSLVHEIIPVDSNTTNQISLVGITSDKMENAAKKKKDGGMMSRAPTLQPTKSPNAFAKTPSSLSNAPTDLTSTFPSFSPPSRNTKLSLRPTAIPGNTLVPSARDKQYTTYVSVASAFAFVALITCAAINLSKKRKKSIDFIRDDPALYGDASIASERSSTFQCNEDGAPASNQPAPFSKRVQKDSVKLLPGSTRQKQRVGAKNVIARFFRFRSINRFERSKEKNTANVYFAPSSPYLIDSYTISMQQTSIDETAINELCHSSSRTDELTGHNLSDIPSLTCDPRFPDNVSVNIPVTEESERIAWRAALEDFDETSSRSHEPQNRQPVFFDQPNLYATLAPSQSNSQISVDDESTGTIDNMYPDIVKQVKSVDQNLKEGLDQFKAVDKQFSIELDKLEASLVRTRGKNKINNCDDLDDSCSSSDVDEFLEKDGSHQRSQLLYGGASKWTNLSAAKPSLYPNSNNAYTDSHPDDINDTSTNDDEKPMNSPFAVPSRYPTYNEHRQIVSSIDDEIDQSRRRCNKFSFSNPPKLLLATKQEDDSFGNSSTEEDDILSTSNEEYDFQSIRKRFNQ
jgi:hypothetical protein